MAKKICYITTMYGTLGFFREQINFLSQNGFEVTAISSFGGNAQQMFCKGVRYLPVEIPRGVSLAGSVKAVYNLKKIFKKENFDLIQYSTPNAAFYASIAAKMVGCKVRNYHLMGLRYLGATGVGQNILKLIEKISCENSTSIECVSKSNLEMGIEESLFPRDKVTVVWNGSSGGIDCRRYDYNKRTQWRKEIRQELGYTESDFVYGFVGRITRDKGINELLEAYFSLHTNAKLFLIGRMEGENTLNVDLLNRARNCPLIQFHDAVTDIEKYYAALDVLMLPSYREGFGNVVIEAGAVGTPAIVSNIPGPIDAIDNGKTALTVEIKNAVDLADKMKRIQTMDYIAMGQNAAVFAKEKYDSKLLNEKILERKRQLLNKK